MRFDITLFPDFFFYPEFRTGRALAKRIAEVHLVNPRDFTTDKHRRVDDEPQGRRRMLPARATFAAGVAASLHRREVILMTPQGQTLNQLCCEN